MLVMFQYLPSLVAFVVVVVVSEVVVLASDSVVYHLL